MARRNAPAELVSHQAYEVAAARKHALLTHLVRSRDMQQALVFVRMKRDANRLARQLEQDGLAATAIHSDRTQTERMQALEEFKQGRMKILVATDIAARGLDIDQLPFVINYELPHTPEDYVHRIGRTGRAGSPGEAISLVSPDEMEFLANIEKLLKRQIPRVAAPGFERESPGGHHRPRDSGDSRGSRDRSHDRKPRPARSTPAAAVNYNPELVFDFTKPYEPAVREGSASPAPEHAASAHRRKPARPTAALLGGRPVQQKSEK